MKRSANKITINFAWLLLCAVLACASTATVDENNRNIAVDVVTTSPLPQLKDCANLGRVSSSSADVAAADEDSWRTRCNASLSERAHVQQLPLAHASTPQPSQTATPPQETAQPAEPIPEAILETLPAAQQHNFALIRDGAKALASNPGAKKVAAILDDDSDTFMRNECKEDKWVVLELSQVAKVNRLELSQHELYSSRVKEFELRGRQSHPRTDNVETARGLNSTSWRFLGRFQAQKTKGVQSFAVDRPVWVRYLLIRFLTHYGSEPVCAINGLGVYGRSAAEELEDQLAGAEVDVALGGEVDVGDAAASIAAALAQETEVDSTNVLPSDGGDSVAADGDGSSVSQDGDGAKVGTMTKNGDAAAGGGSGSGGGVVSEAPSAEEPNMTVNTAEDGVVEVNSQTDTPDVEQQPSTATLPPPQDNEGHSPGGGKGKMPAGDSNKHVEVDTHNDASNTQQPGGSGGGSEQHAAPLTPSPTTPQPAKGSVNDAPSPSSHIPSPSPKGKSSTKSSTSRDTASEPSASATVPQTPSIVGNNNPNDNTNDAVGVVSPNVTTNSTPLATTLLPAAVPSASPAGTSGSNGASSSTLDPLEQLPVPKSKVGSSIYDVLIQELRAAKAQQRLMTRVIDALQRNVTALAASLGAVRTEYELSDAQLAARVESLVETQLNSLAADVAALRQTLKGADKRQHAAMSLLAMVGGVLALNMPAVTTCSAFVRRFVTVLVLLNGGVALALFWQGVHGERAGTGNGLLAFLQSVM